MCVHLRACVCHPRTQVCVCHLYACMCHPHAWMCHLCACLCHLLVCVCVTSMHAVCVCHLLACVCVSPTCMRVCHPRACVCVCVTRMHVCVCVCVTRVHACVCVTHVHACVCQPCACTGPDPGRFWCRDTDFGDIEFGRPQNKSRTKTKKGSQFITESKISKVRELIPALTRLCTQRSQDPMIDWRHLPKYARKFSKVRELIHGT